MSDDKRARKPIPRPSPESLPFWEAAKVKRLLLPRCNHCGRFFFQPSQRCRHCLSPDLAWVESKGIGRIYSFVVYHRSYHPAFESDIPYAVAIVELDEGVRLLSNIIGTPPESLRCDARVRVTFEERDGASIPMFELAP
jgi:uncharacterized OB-fold protein